MWAAVVVEQRFVEDHLVRSPFGGAAAQGSQRNDADQVLVRSVEDGQPLYMTLAHDPVSLPSRIIVETKENLGRHRLAHGHLTDITRICDAPHRDIAIGDHSDHPIVVAYRQGTDVFRLELSGCSLK